MPFWVWHILCPQAEKNGGLWIFVPESPGLYQLAWLPVLALTFASDIALSFGFYMPAALWAHAVSMIGMPMISKARAYVWPVLIRYFAMKQGCK